MVVYCALQSAVYVLPLRLLGAPAAAACVAWLLLFSCSASGVACAMAAGDGGDGAGGAGLSPVGA